MSKHQSFLREKLNNINVGRIILLEIQGLSFWIFNTIPGTIGFFFRFLVAKLFFKKVKGFTWIQPRVTLVEIDRLSVGKNFAVNSGTYINAIGGIEIGNFVLIGSNVTISSGMHPIEGRFPHIFERQTIPKPIIIEDGVWIGAGAVIMPGIIIKKGTVIGANSVVTKNTEEFSIVAGCPARLLRYRSE